MFVVVIEKAGKTGVVVINSQSVDTPEISKAEQGRLQSGSPVRCPECRRTLLERPVLTGWWDTASAAEGCEDQIRSIYGLTLDDSVKVFELTVSAPVDCENDPPEKPKQRRRPRVGGKKKAKE